MCTYIYILHIYRTRRWRKFPKIRPIGRGGVRSSIGSKMNWCQIQVKWDSSDLVVNWFEIQMLWLSIDECFKWFWLSVDSNFKCGGCQLIWDSSGLVVKWFEVQVSWLSTDVWFKWFCQTKLFCETSFKNVALQLKNEAFLPDFFQNWSFATQKRSFSARLPSKLKLWRSKTKHFCETSFKIDMLSRHLTSEFQYVLAIFKWMLQKYCACNEKVEPRHTKSCNCHAKWSLQHEICNPSTVSASNASNIDITKREILAPATRNASFQTLFKSPTPANVFATLTNSCACRVFCNASKSLRLPRETHFQPPKTSRAPGVLTILTSKSLSRAGAVQILRSSTSKSAPNLSIFNDFDFRIALARKRGANFVDVNFQKCSDTASF